MNLTLKNKLPLLGLLILVALLPFSALITPAIIILAIFTFLGQGYSQCRKNLKENKSFILLSSIFFIYLLGMIHTENIKFGFRDLEYKFSLFVFPIILAALNRLAKNDLNLTKGIFVLASLFSAIVSFAIGWIENGFSEVPHYSDLNVFLHPTFFSIYLNLCMIFLIEHLKTFKALNLNIFLNALLFLFFLIFNFLLFSKIGIIIAVGLLLHYSFIIFKLLPRQLSWTVGVLTFLAIVVFLSNLSGLTKRFQNLKVAANTDNISNDSNESTALRVLIWRQVAEIAEENPFVGVGTGDTKDELMAKYASNGITYAEEKNLNAHSQYFEWLVTFGYLGLTFFLFVFLYFFQLAWKERRLVFISFSIVLLTVFAVEGFLERQAGVVFAAFFYSLLFFHSSAERKSKFVFKSTEL